MEKQQKQYQISVGGNAGRGVAVMVVSIEANNTGGSLMVPGASFFVQRNGGVLGDNNCHFDVKISWSDFWCPRLDTLGYQSWRGAAIIYWSK